MVPVFGTSFSVYIPILMIIVALMTVLNVYAHLMRIVGIESEDSIQITNIFSFVCWKKGTMVPLNDEELEKYEAGKKLVANEIRTRTQSCTSTSTPSVSSTHSRSNSNSNIVDDYNIENIKRNFKNSNKEDINKVNSQIPFNFSNYNKIITNNNNINNSTNNSTSGRMNNKLNDEANNNSNKSRSINTKNNENKSSMDNFGLDEDEEEQPYYGGRYTNI